jgi:hypothetical protein
MADFVGIDVTGLPELQRILAKLPDAVADEVVDQASDYLLNVMRSNQAPYRYIPRRAAYPPTGWHSDRQRKKVMAMIREGKITPGRKNRTGALVRGWKQVGRGRQSIIANEEPAAYYTMDDNGQSNHARLIGWKTVGALISEHGAKLDKVVAGAAERGMKRAGAK